MRNASGQQGETSKVKMIDSEKKGEQEHKQQNLWWAHTTIPHFIIPLLCHFTI